MPKRTPPGHACRFCGIVSGTEPAFVVFRDELSVAFLDYRPLALGHVLLVPVAHYATLEALPDEVAAGLAVRIKWISAAVIEAMDADGSFVGLNNRISQSVPHVHFHIVPRKKGDGLFAHRMIWKRVAYRDDAHRAETANRITRALQLSPSATLPAHRSAD